ncbi:MAG: PH domain-containing protein [Treponema sp.]|nr:PH domain-containing protein [Treponema sp.]
MKKTIMVIRIKSVIFIPSILNSPAGSMNRFKIKMNGSMSVLPKTGY